MSRKSLRMKAELSTEPVDTPRHNAHRMNDLGEEIVSNISLVSVADQRPMTLGERVRRYMNTPQFQHDLDAGALDDFTDEDFDLVPLSDEAPISAHEDRSRELKKRVRKRLTDEAEAKKQKAIEAEKAEKEAFRKRYNELRAEAEGTAPPPPPEGAK